MSDMVEVVIDSVRVSLMSPQRLVVLRQLDADRFLPIWVGPYEAEAITVALQEIEMIRPLTHDLLKNIFTTFNTRIMRVEIVSLREDIYYGNIIAESDTGQRIIIDSRPSDAIALAVRAHVPILVSPDVMTTAGIIPEKDIAAQVQPAARAISGRLQRRWPNPPPPSLLNLPTTGCPSSKNTSPISILIHLESQYLRPKQPPPSTGMYLRQKVHLHQQKRTNHQPKRPNRLRKNLPKKTRTTTSRRNPKAKLEE